MSVQGTLLDREMQKFVESPTRAGYAVPEVVVGESALPTGAATEATLAAVEVLLTRQGTLTDHSGTTAVTSTQIVAASATRRYFFFKNMSSNKTMFINFTTAATTASPSILINPSESFIMEHAFVSTEAVNLISGTAGEPYVCKVG